MNLVFPHYVILEVPFPHIFYHDIQSLHSSPKQFVGQRYALRSPLSSCSPMLHFSCYALCGAQEACGNFLVSHAF